MDHTEEITRRAFLKKIMGAIASTSIPNDFFISGYVSQQEYYVYISRHTSYHKKDYSSLKDTVSKMVSALYQEKPFFSYRDTVSLKVNLVSSMKCLRRLASKTYVTHPLVVKALGEALLDIGAGSIYIIEGATHPSDTMKAFSDLGYDKIASYLGATLINLNKPDPYTEFSKATIEGGLVYDSIKVHHHFFETDCLVSVAKLKAHSSAGVTLSLKNMIGILPVQEYGIQGSGARIQHVHSLSPKTQIPYNIVDMNRLFPVDFAFIDGISSINKGEGPWVKDISRISPGVLIAGNNPVAVDSVATTVMGFDPTADYPVQPFANCYNHIRLAADYNLGSNILSDIKIFGERVDDVITYYG